MPTLLTINGQNVVNLPKVMPAKRVTADFISKERSIDQSLTVDVINQTDKMVYTLEWDIMEKSDLEFWEAFNYQECTVVSTIPDNPFTGTFFVSTDSYEPFGAARKSVTVLLEEI
jgi:hypothetical protein